MGCTTVVKSQRNRKKNSIVPDRKRSHSVDVTNSPSQKPQIYIDLRQVSQKDCQEAIRAINNEVSCTMDWTDYYIDKTKSSYSLCHIYMGLSRFVTNISKSKIRISESWVMYHLKDLSYLRQINLERVKIAMNKLIPKIQEEFHREYKEKSTLTMPIQKSV